MKDQLFHQEIGINEENLKSQQFWRIMELPELSLAPTQRRLINKSTNSSSSESETFPSRKRKSLCDHLLNSEPIIQTSVDLQLKDRLPLDWEQCLDLESGRMYYLNRKTLRKSWEWPNNVDQKLDLELNMKCSSSSTERLEEEYSKKHHSSSNSSNSMVALACLNCHLLVILSKSSPSCPNCKYVHSLPTQQILPPKNSAFNSLDTLSLLN